MLHILVGLLLSQPTQAVSLWHVRMNIVRSNSSSVIVHENSCVHAKKDSCVHTSCLSLSMHVDL